MYSFFEKDEFYGNVKMGLQSDFLSHTSFTISILIENCPVLQGFTKNIYYSYYENSQGHKK